MPPNLKLLRVGQIHTIYTKKRGELLALHHACDLGGARTLDPLIKSQLLYQLSYEVICFGRSLPLVCECKGNTKYLFDQNIGLIFSPYPDFA